MPSLNPTAQERLDARDRHVRLWRFARPIAAAFARLKFNYTWDDLRDIEPPYLLLCNHVLNLDPVLVGVAMHNHGYFVATENLLHLGWVTKLLMRYCCPIITQKGRKGVRSTMDLLKTIAAGSSVALFPEGDRSFDGLTGPIAPATSKVARKAGKLVCVRFEGGYLTYPRWATTMRRGRLHLRLVGVYTANDMAAMSNEELLEAIKRDLHEDAYARQEAIAAEEGAPVRFAGRHLGLGMESALFICPECGGVGALASDDDGIRCTAPGCGMSARYLPTGYLEGGRFSTVTQWDQWQRSRLAELMAAAGPDEPLFADDVTLELYDDDHVLVTATPGRLTAFARHATFVPAGQDGNEPQVMRVDLEQIEGMGLFLRNTLIAHAGSPVRHYEVRGDLRFCALKYRYVYNLAAAAPAPSAAPAPEQPPTVA